MGQGKIGRGTQQQHKKATPHSYLYPCQNEPQTIRVGWNFCTYMTHAWCVVCTITQLAYSSECKISYSEFFFSVFSLDVYPGLGISDVRDLFFRGPIWMRLQNSDNFCVGQVPGTSHVAPRPKKHTCERRICPSLSRPFAAGPASSLFVVVQRVVGVIGVPGTKTVVVSPVFFPYFFVFFCRLVLEKKNRYSRVLEEIILFAAACCIFRAKRVSNCYMQEKKN